MTCPIHKLRLSLPLLAIFWLVGSYYSMSALGQEVAEVVGYDEVRAVLKKRCGTCHSGSQLRGELDLSSWSGIEAGSVSGPVVIAGKPDESLLYTLSAHLDDPKMPPNRPRIPQRELDVIRRWIEGGLQRGGVVADSNPVPTNELPLDSPNSPRPLSQRSAATALAISPNGSQVAASGVQQVLLFDANSGEVVHSLPFRRGEVHVLRYSGDGMRLLAAGGTAAVEGFALGYDMTTGMELFKVGDESDVALAADRSPDGRYVALGGPGRTVNVYNVETGDRVHTLRRHTDWILSLAFSPDGLLLASGDRFGGLQAWEVGSGREFHTLRGHTSAVTTVQWLGGSELLLSASEDGTARVWDMHTGNNSVVHEPGVEGILAAGMDAENNLYLGTRGGELVILDQKGQVSWRTSLPGQVVELAVSSDGSRFAAADGSGRMTSFASTNLDQAIDLKVPLSSELVKADVILPAPRLRPEPVVPLASSANATFVSELPALLQELQQSTVLLGELRAATERCEQKLEQIEQRLSNLEQRVESQPRKP